MVGCEEAKGIHGLTIDPSSVVLASGSNSVSFEATLPSTYTNNLLAYPIEWSVTDPSLGTIVGNSGNNALYQRTGKNGNNTVIARDQYDNEGYATVKQIFEQYTVNLSASPNPIPVGTNICTVTASGGVALYKWWVRDSAYGSIISTGHGSATAVYRSKQPGDNVIHARDANGVTGTVNVEQLP